MIRGYTFMANSPSPYNLLEEIRKRPALFLGNTKQPFTILLGFIAGYGVGYGSGKHGVRPAHLIPNEFSQFVTEHFGHSFPAGGKGWSSFVSEHTNSEQEAFELFFRLLDAYEKRNTNAA